LEGGDVEEPFDLPVNVAEPHRGPDYDALGGEHHVPLHLFDCPNLDTGPVVKHPLSNRVHHGICAPVPGGVNYQRTVLEGFLRYVLEGLDDLDMIIRCVELRPRRPYRNQGSAQFFPGA
jgi:hypothetical protein